MSGMPTKKRKASSSKKKTTTSYKKKSATSVAVSSYGRGLSTAVRLGFPLPPKLIVTLKATARSEFSAATSPQTFQFIGNDAQCGNASGGGGSFTPLIPGGLYYFLGSQVPSGGNSRIATGMYNRCRVIKSTMILHWTPAGVNAAAVDNGTVTLSVYPSSDTAPDSSTTNDAAIEQRFARYRKYPNSITTMAPQLATSMRTAYIMGFSKECMIEDGNFDSKIVAGTYTSPTTPWFWNIMVSCITATGTNGTLYGELAYELHQEIEFFNPNFASQAVPT